MPNEPTPQIGQDRGGQLIEPPPEAAPGEAEIGRDREGSMVTCRRCGAMEVVDGDGLPAGWSLVTDERGLGYLCLACTRTNVRSIEAKLPEEWWE